MAEKDRLLNNISECKAILKVSKEVFARETKRKMQEKYELYKVKSEVSQAQAAFEEQEKKYQAFRENIPF